MRLVPPPLPAASPLILAATAHHHTGPLTLILLGCAVLVIYVLVAFARPVKKCGRCHGKGNVHLANGSAPVCPRCNGLGKHYRAGATLIHRLYQDALRERGRRLPIPQPPQHPGEES